MNADTAEMDGMLKVRQIAQRLSCSENKVRALCRRKVDPIPHIDIGSGDFRIDPDDLEDWIEEVKSR